jgi:predicted double-glycine peptidase
MRLLRWGGAKPWARACALAFAAALAGGCATPIHSVNDSRLKERAPTLRAVDLKFVAQQTKYSCGAAALESVLTYWDTPLSQSWLLENVPPASTKKGYQIGELKAVAEARNLNAFAVEADFAFLEKQIDAGRPIIVPLETKYLSGIYDTPLLGPISRLVYQTFMPSYSHYVVVFGYDDGRMWVMDPNEGLRSIKRKKFLKEWEKRGRAALLISA